VIERVPAPQREPAIARAEGVFFGHGSRPRFGWVHRPAIANGVGLVIVPPFGYEAICAHRALRHLASAAAKAGVVAVRFDLDGTGDSAGDDLDPGRLDAWLASISDACDLARAHGATRLVLAGVRLGATLATLAAATRSDIVGLVAIAAVPSGKALVREGRALQMQLGLEPAPADVAHPPEDIHEQVGFALTAETRAALSKIDLLKVGKPAPAVLVVDRDDLPPNEKWLEALRASGAEVEHARLAGYVEMVMDPHRTVVPAAIIEATVAFAAARTGDPFPAPAEAITSAARAEVPVDGTSVTEELVHIDGQLVGVCSRMRSEPVRGVILLNAGAVPRVGPNRLYVPIARKLAAHGALVLRVDLSGIGDSAPRSGCAENIVYSEQAVRDVAAAVAWVRRQGAPTVAVVGLCSGAYHAFKAAVAGESIDTVVPINPLTFFYKPGMPLDFAAFRVTEAAQRYQKSMRSAKSWKKLLRGNVNLVRVARIVMERGRAMAEHKTRDVLRQLRVPMRDDLGSEILALDRRGVATRFIFAGGDPGRAMLLEQGGAAAGRVTSVDVIEGPDHTFTPRWSHPLLEAAIMRAVVSGRR
jgi:pimeloyl-ACP methyl ester carboxylesterase